ATACRVSADCRRRGERVSRAVHGARIIAQDQGAVRWASGRCRRRPASTWTPSAWAVAAYDPVVGAAPSTGTSSSDGGGSPSPGAAAAVRPSVAAGWVAVWTAFKSRIDTLV